MRFLVTGGLGFIGSNYIRMLHRETDYDLVCLDKVTYAGNTNNLNDLVTSKRYKFVKGDICDKKLIDQLLSEGFDVIVNFAAESHVDRSLFTAEKFVESNINGTFMLLEAALKHRVPRFIQISTDEVYGSADDGKPFTETSILNPSSPYSSTKAAADLLCLSYFKTFNLPVIITRSTNNFGPFQHPEKFIPLFITNALEDKECPLYGDGLNKRDWIYVEDNCRAIQSLVTKGKEGQVYNISGSNLKSNVDVANMIMKTLGKPQSLIKQVKDRPAHDKCYLVDSSKFQKEIGSVSSMRFEDAFVKTVEWYKNNMKWIKAVKQGEFSEFYKLNYGNR